MEKNNKNREKKQKPERLNFLKGLILWIIVLGIILSLAKFTDLQDYTLSKKSITYSEFLKKVEKGEIKGTVTIKEGYVYGTLKDGTKFRTYSGKDPDLYRILRENNINFQPQPSSYFLSNLFFTLISIAFFLFLFRFIALRQATAEHNRVMSFTKSRPLMPDTKNKITFDDVAGCEEAKEEFI